MRKLRRSHVAVALLAVVSVVSLLGASLTAVRGVTPPAGYTSIFEVKPIAKTVWWEVAPGVMIIFWLPRTSGIYNCWGRTRLHVLMVAQDLESGEEIDVRVYGKLWNADRSAAKNVMCTEWTLTYSNPSYDSWTYVPSTQFYFWTYGPSDTKVSLYFYLTL